MLSAYNDAASFQKIYFYIYIIPQIAKIIKFFLYNINKIWYNNYNKGRKYQEPKGDIFYGKMDKSTKKSN